MDIVERARQEIKELHAFFGQWYAAPQDVNLERVASVLAAEFELLSPSGEVLSRQQVLDELLTNRGAYPDLSISVEGLVALKLRDQQVSARYTEIHFEPEKCERRRCCALLRSSGRAQSSLEWVAIGEWHDV